MDIGWGLAVFIAASILVFTFVVRFAYDLGLGIFDKIEHVLLTLVMLVSTGLSLWLISVVYVRSA